MNFEILKTVTILYVEDEADLQENIYQNLIPFVKEIIRANDGQIGLDLYKEHHAKIDVIISDILMPNMNGMEMIDNIRELSTDVPVIYATAFDDNKYLQKTIEQSVTSYIIKPIDIELLLEAIVKSSLQVLSKKKKEFLEEKNVQLSQTVESKTQELEIQNSQLQYQLYTDNLTNLKNRKSLIEDVENIINPVFILVDIDSFSNINDLYGEDVGDVVIQKVASILNSFMHYIGLNLYRASADKFAIIGEAKLDRTGYEDIMNNIIAKISENPLVISEHNLSIRVNVTVGISQERNDTFKSAEVALSKAKATRVPYKFYSKEYSVDEQHKNEVRWTKIIENAIKTDNVVVYYQPIVCTNETVLKYEALIRIIEGDIVHSPMDFLDIAKKVKFYTKLTKIVISLVLKKAQETNINININLSIEDIVNVEILDYIKEEFTKMDVAKFITFEILESENITDYEKVISFIDVVKALGCKIAIDDFGSGYSNFAYLLKLKPEYIKIDGSLIKNIHTDQNSYLITKSINEFAHSLGIKTVAEYVHNQEVFEILKETGVDECQGYFFSEPKKDTQ